MPGAAVDLTVQDFKTIETEALIIGCFEDVRPLKGTAGLIDWLLCGALSQLLIDKRLAGKLGDVALLTSRGKIPARKLFLVGCGPRATYCPASLREAVKTAASGAVLAGASRAVVEYLHPDGAGYEESTAAFLAGIAEGTGGRTLAVTVLAPDAETFGRLAQAMPGARQVPVS